MRISVKVKTNSKESTVSSSSNGEYTVNLKSKPFKGEANLELISVLSKHFDIPKSCITIVKGLKAKNKVVAIEEYED